MFVHRTSNQLSSEAGWLVQRRLGWQFWRRARVRVSGKEAELARLANAARTLGVDCLRAIIGFSTLESKCWAAESECSEERTTVVMRPGVYLALCIYFSSLLAILVW